MQVATLDHPIIVPPSPQPTELASALADLGSVDLKTLDQAQLHDRQESKVLLRADDIPAALARLASDYLVMEHEGERVQGYLNEYFDSSSLHNYHEHHNQKGRRVKVRYRTYVNSDLTFFEVKRNVNGRTVKDRRMSERPTGQLQTQDAPFLFKLTGNRPSTLQLSVEIGYQRILLVKRDFSERVTIDMNLSFRTERQTTEPTGLAVCEFKQPRLDLRSPAMEAMNRRPQNFSKYCMALASCDPTLRRNRFKKVFRNLEKLGALPTPPQELLV
ncbi:MAG: hypothetical protein ACI8TP_004001 [Acidimicrobiales bacterium]|jgi:hypothetical protein